MLLKRKEMVKKIRNCKKILNNFYSDKKFYTANQTEENLLSLLEGELNKNITNTKFSKINNESNKIKDSPIINKKIMSDINYTNNNTKNITNDLIKIRN